MITRKLERLATARLATADAGEDAVDAERAHCNYEVGNTNECMIMMTNEATDLDPPSTTDLPPEPEADREDDGLTIPLTGS